MRGRWATDMDIPGSLPEEHGDVADPSKVPSFSEPWFLAFNADVEFHIVMTPDDLQKAGLEELGKKWS